MKDLESILKDTGCPEERSNYHHLCPTCNGTRKKFHELWIECLCTCHQSTLRRGLSYVESGGIIIHIRGCKPSECEGYVFSVDVAGLLKAVWRVFNERGVGVTVEFRQHYGGAITCCLRHPGWGSLGRTECIGEDEKAALWDVLSKTMIGG